MSTNTDPLISYTSSCDIGISTLIPVQEYTYHPPSHTGIVYTNPSTLNLLHYTIPKTPKELTEYEQKQINIYTDKIRFIENQLKSLNDEKLRLHKVCNKIRGIV